MRSSPARRAGSAPRVRAAWPVKARNCCWRISTARRRSRWPMNSARHRSRWTFTRAADIDRMFDLAYRRWGRIDVLFNNAGIAEARRMLELTPEEWDRTLAVNLRAVFFVLQAAAKRMRQQTPIAGSELRGKLIQTASIAAYRGGQGYMVHYGASKAGVVSVTRTAAQVLAADRITSNCVCPGAVDTAMWKKIDAEWSEIEGWRVGEAWKRRTAIIPLGRPETAEDVAGVVSFLASRDSDYMTGQAVNVDGGLVMGN